MFEKARMLYPVYSRMQNAPHGLNIVNSHEIVLKHDRSLLNDPQYATLRRTEQYKQQFCETECVNPMEYIVELETPSA